MPKTLILFFLGLVVSVGFSLSSPACAQVVQKALSLKNDSAKVELRSFDPDKIKTYSSQRDFQYDDALPIGATLWDRFWDWVWKLVTLALENEYSGNLGQYIVIAVVVALIVLAISKIAGVDLSMLSRKSKAVEIPYAEVIENIHEIDFNGEIDKAIAEGNYRLAVRLLYLHSLKWLNDQGRINWQPEKTNQVYIEELVDLQTKEAFKALTLQFEYIWYGEFSIDKEDFKLLKTNFESFNRKKP